MPYDSRAMPAAASAVNIAASTTCHRTKLSSFWPTKPFFTFVTAEGQFFLNITEELVLCALPDSAVGLIANVLEKELPADPYTQLKAQLLQAHRWRTGYQKVERLSQLSPLGSQKHPS